MPCLIADIVEEPVGVGWSEKSYVAGREPRGCPAASQSPRLLGNRAGWADSAGRAAPEAGPPTVRSRLRRAACIGAS